MSSLLAEGVNIYSTMRQKIKFNQGMLKYKRAKVAIYMENKITWHKQIFNLTLF